MQTNAAKVQLLQRGQNSLPKSSVFPMNGYMTVACKEVPAKVSQRTLRIRLVGSQRVPHRSSSAPSIRQRDSSASGLMGISSFSCRFGRGFSFAFGLLLVP